MVSSLCGKSLRKFNIRRLLRNNLELTAYSIVLVVKIQYKTPFTRKKKG